MLIQEVSYLTADYKKTLQLRNNILREPLGKKLTSQDTQGEPDHLHFATLYLDSAIACVIAVPLEGLAKIKLRQMAVATEWQRQGLGLSLINYVENTLYPRGTREIELSARLETKGFYQKLGYKAVNSVYLEIGIEHIKMHKYLTKN